jgi:hypothetical protein
MVLLDRILFCLKIPRHYAPVLIFSISCEETPTGLFLEKKLGKNIGLLPFGKN